MRRYSPLARVLLLTVLATVGIATAAAQGVRGIFTGSRTVVFDTSTQSCELIDIPDTSATAFRDYKGTVHLVSSGSVMWQNLGPALESVTHSCKVAYRSRHDPNPADFNDNTWLDSFYSIDGKNIVAMGHMEYHGWEHPGGCSVHYAYIACWYNADTFNFSTDGGYHFQSPPPPGNFVAGLPYQYEIDQGPEGYSINTNIVKVGKWYYTTVFGWPWPPNCGQFGYPKCEVPDGGAPMRTSDILDPASWRAWDGHAFAMSFADPYPGPVKYPEAHVFAPIQYLDSVNSINYDEAHQLFVALYFDPYDREFGGPPGAYLATSPDLVNWSTPTMLVSVAQLQAKEPPGNWSYGYFSLLDPNSSDDNFSTITDSPNLYYVRFDDHNPPYVRVLFSQPIKLTWK